METLFSSLGSQIYETSGHKGYMIEWKLLYPICKKWSRNRDADKERVNEIKDFLENGGYVPQIIHLAELKDEGIVCYDGNHRREVFNITDKKIICIVDVMFSATQMDVYKSFTALNKSVQVPEIYIEDDCKNVNVVKEEILEFVKRFEKKYKQFISASPRCHSPNFNRDCLIDNIYSLYKSFNGVVGIKQIEVLLETLNCEYSRGNICRNHKCYKRSVLDKCKQYNLWLFLEKTIPFEHVEYIFNN